MDTKLYDSFFEEDTEGIAGKEFGVLVAVRKRRKGLTSDIWLCVCKRCGGHRNISLDKLQHWQYDSCGYCVSRREKTPEEKRRASVYQAWSNMKNRCYNEKNPRYMNYGGRGIIVHDEWRLNFQSFYDYVSHLPHYGEPGRSIDRIDNDKGYFPGNIRWATAKEQCNNRRKRNGKRKEETV